jgi:hypothetical protein
MAARSAIFLAASLLATPAWPQFHAFQPVGQTGETQTGPGQGPTLKPADPIVPVAASDSIAFTGFSPTTSPGPASAPTDKAPAATPTGSLDQKQLPTPPQPPKPPENKKEDSSSSPPGGGGGGGGDQGGGGGQKGGGGGGEGGSGEVGPSSQVQEGGVGLGAGPDGRRVTNTPGGMISRDGVGEVQDEKGVATKPGTSEEKK